MQGADPDWDVRYRATPAAMLLVLAGIAIAAQCAVLMLKGIWYDELFTVYVTRQRVGFADAFRSYWLSDNHPPLFYAISWITGLLSDDIYLRRLQNLVFFAVAAGFTVLAMRGSRWTSAERYLFFCAILSSLSLYSTAALLRSYLLSYLATGLLAVMLVRCTREETDGAARDFIYAGCIAVVAANIHYVTTLVTGCLIAAFVVRSSISRRARHAIMFFVIGAVSFAPFLTLFVIAYSDLEQNTRSFWIPAGLSYALRAFAGAAREALQSALPVAALAGTGIVLGVARKGLGSAWDRGVADAATLAAGLTASVLALLAIHSWRPVVFEYYLVGMIAPGYLALAIPAARILEASGPRMRLFLIWLVFAWTVSAIAYAVWQVPKEANLLTAARIIKSEIARCPDTVVHADPHPHKGLTELPPRENGIVSLATYRWTARVYGFEVEPFASRRISATCPTLFWSAYYYNAETIAQSSARLRSMGYDLGSLRRLEAGPGSILRQSPKSREAT